MFCYQVRTPLVFIPLAFLREHFLVDQELAELWRDDGWMDLHRHRTNNFCGHNNLILSFTFGQELS